VCCAIYLNHAGTAHVQMIEHSLQALLTYAPAIARKVEKGWGGRRQVFVFFKKTRSAHNSSANMPAAHTRDLPVHGYAPTGGDSPGGIPIAASAAATVALRWSAAACDAKINLQTAPPEKISKWNSTNRLIMVR